MGIPPLPRRLGRGVGLSATKSRVSEGRGRACADYAERERLHCEAIIFFARPLSHPTAKKDFRCNP
ncbi:MAG: hypothetical protein LBQ31_04370 [Bacteroidales bacterium]|nr:hypothetical protein [Bacteroidales bacterium]